MTTTTAVATQETRQLTPAQAKAQSIKAYVYKNLSSIQQALPNVGLTPESVARAALTQIYKNPMLMDCDKGSLMRSIIEAAQLGLPFVLGRAYLVPFKNRKENRLEATLIPGYQGLADIARRSGEISTIQARNVYVGDEFEFSFSIKEDLLSHKQVGDPDDKKLLYSYAIVRFKDGGYQVDVMTKAQIDKVRARSKAKDSGPWVDDYGEMAKKTVVKRVLKLCPMSVDLQRAVEIDNRAESGEALSFDLDIEALSGGDHDLVAEDEGPKSTTQTLKDRLSEAKQDANTKAIDVTPEPDEESDPDPRDAVMRHVGILYDTVSDILKTKSKAKLELAISEATDGKVRGWDVLEAFTPDVFRLIEMWIDDRERAGKGE